MLGSVLGSGDTSINKTRQNSIPIRNSFTACKKKRCLCSRIPAGGYPTEIRNPIHLIKL